jgi:hypothetical protein
VNAKLSKSFPATLEATGTSLRWVIARVPIDLKKAWPMWKSRRVFGEINGFAFKTALIPGARGQGHEQTGEMLYRSDRRHGLHHGGEQLAFPALA